MRILAKLSSRRLTFAQEQQLDGNTFGSQVPQFVQPDDAATTTTFVGQQPPQKSLWVSNAVVNLLCDFLSLSLSLPASSGGERDVAAECCSRPIGLCEKFGEIQS